MTEITAQGVEEILRLFKQKHSTYKTMRVNALEEITTGWETNIFSFTLQYTENNIEQLKDFVIRMYHGSGQNEQAQKEFEVMQMVAEQGVAVPEVELLVVNNTAFENAFVVMEKVPGQTMLAAFDMADEDKRNQLIKLKAQHFSQLHQIPVSEFAEHELPNTDDYLNNLLVEMAGTINKFGLSEFDPYMKLLEEQLAQGITPSLALLHNDYHVENLLMDAEDKNAYIVDWSFAEVGDYRLDLAWAVLLVGTMAGEEYRKLFLDYYQEASGEKVLNFQFFEILKFTMRMLTIVTWLQDSVEIPVKKITKEAIRTDYKIHVLNVYHRLKAITGLSLPTIEAL